MAATARPSVVTSAGGGPWGKQAPALVELQTGRFRPTMLALLWGAVIWEVTSRALGLAFMPSLVTVLQATWRLTISGEIPNSLRASVGILVVGYGLAALVGVPLGLILGRRRLLAFVVDPYLDAMLAVPSLLLVPVFFGLFGLGRATEVAVVFVYSLVIIVVMTRSGLATLDAAYVDMARVFGASERQIFRRVLLPGALPTIMAALRLGVGRALRGLVNAEMLIGPAGLGALLRQYGGRFDAASVYGILIVLVALAVGVNWAMHLADQRLNHWAN